MSIYVLDTSILVGYIYGSEYAEYIEAKYSIMQPSNITVVSSVTIGEMLSLAIQLNWGEKKKQEMEKLLEKFPTVDIGDRKILERYAEIDAYSQGKHPEKKLPKGMGPRNMGKNDVWIAATGSILKATLLTTDQHFDHLDSIFLRVIYIDQNLKKEDTNVK
jgi:tRNA(fMet)-specific endonuclease VapC